MLLLLLAIGLRGAHNQNRTGDLFLTKEVLCRLSYVGLLSVSAIRTRFMERETGFEPVTFSLEG